jgi:AcrR family transcriptional regulator
MPRTPRTGPRHRPRQKRAEDTVGVLLTATERVLVRDGFSATNTNRIAEIAGVSIGTLYHYFPTTEALIEAVVHRMWADELMILSEGVSLLESAPLAEVIALLCQKLADKVHSRRQLYRRWYAEASHLGQLDVGLQMANRAIDVLYAVFEKRRDELRPKNLRFACDFVVKVVLAAVRTAARDYPDELASGELASALADMVTRYLVK